MLMRYEPLPQDAEQWINPTHTKNIVLFDSADHGRNAARECEDFAKLAAERIGAVTPASFMAPRINARRAADIDWDSVDVGPFSEHARGVHDGQARIEAYFALPGNDAKLNVRGKHWIQYKQNY